MPTDRKGEKIQVLLAEDNPGDVFLVREFLKKADLDFELHVAENGEEALSYLQQAEKASVPRPDLILLDLNMPRNNGAEVLKGVRESKRLSEIPVVVFTSSDDLKDRVVAERLGASSYLQKPSTLEEYMRVGEHIKELYFRS